MDRRDIAALLGLGSIGYGAWQIYPPAALIFAGAAIFAWAFITTPATPPPEQESRSTTQ